MGITLKKGQRLSFDDRPLLNRIRIGVNWGGIPYRTWYGKQKTEAVDLDLAVGLFHRDRSLIETIYYDKTKSHDGAIVHSGDDETGNIGNDENKDNEVITVDLEKLRPQVAHLVFVLHSFQWHPWDEIPYAKIRVYNDDGNTQALLASLEVKRDEEFAHKVSMILGKLYRTLIQGQWVWRFHAIGVPTEDKELPDLMRNISVNHLTVEELSLIAHLR
jgi:tellurium resistance protein TerZ